MSEQKEASITTYKGFNKDLTCRGFQYELGKTYKHDRPVVRCGTGFHACENPFEVLNYYAAQGGNRFAEVEQAGQMARDDSDTKVASAEITVRVELSLPELLARGAAYLVGLGKKFRVEMAGTHKATMEVGAQRGTTATTGYGSAAATTGNYSAAATTGNYSAAATTGNGSAAATTGYGSAAATTGYGSAAATTGERSAAATTGYGSAASVKGKSSIAAALGPNSTASAEAGGAIMLAAYDVNGVLKAVFASKVGQNDIEPGKTYRLQCNGVLVEVK